MFDPNGMAATKMKQAALRRITEWANTTLTSLAKELPDSTARLSVREVQCLDPECITPEGVEVLITMTAEGWSLTGKILKSAKSCSKEEVVSCVEDLCKGAKPRAVAASAKKVVEARGDIVPMSTESFTVRVLTHIDKEFLDKEARITALKMLHEAIQHELIDYGEIIIADDNNNNTKSASSDTVGSDNKKEQAVSPPPVFVKRAKPAPTLRMASSRFMENDGDEAVQMNRHKGLIQKNKNKKAVKCALVCSNNN
jgi:hypothetical protein